MAFWRGWQSPIAGQVKSNIENTSIDQSLGQFLRSQYGRFFAFILVVSIALVTIAGVENYKDVYAEHEEELTALHLLLKRSASDRLLQTEVLFKNLGQQIANLGGDVAAIQRLIDEALYEDPIFQAYGIADVNGNLLYVSDELRGRLLPILLEDPSSARSFRKALDSRNIVIGDTYFFPPLNRWLIPFRYAVRNLNGDINLVITTAIALEGIHNPWRILAARDDVGITVTSDRYDNGEFYPIYYDPLPAAEGRKEDLYQKPLPAEVIDEVIGQISKVSGVSFDVFTARGKPVAYINNLNPEEPALAVLSHDLIHGYYLGIRRPLSIIQTEVWQYVALISVFALLFNLLAVFVLRREFLANLLHESTLQARARQDYLTGLPNRFAFEDSWSPSQHSASDIAVLFIDLDNFRFINDHFGHAVGDRVLINIGAYLQNVLLSGEQLYRLGGDEFLVITPETDSAKLRYLAEQILYRVNEMMLVDSIKVSLTASIGICIAADEVLLGQMVSKADHAMYEAKKVRNHFAFYEHAVDGRQDKMLEIENQLRTVDLKQEIEVVYQPQIVTGQAAVVGVEVLARWRNENLGSVSPSLFIPVAEKTGKIIEIGEIVIDKAFSELKACPKFGQIKQVSLNISVHQFMYGGIAKHLDQKTSAHGISPKRIILEITENLFVEDFQYLSNLLQDIRRKGYEISLDDFGTGYSSLSLIRELAIDELKIDKSFVDDILDSEDARGLIQSIIGIGKSLGIPVLAEGTENAEQVALLTEFGCDRFQGYHFAKPMPIDELEEFLKNLNNEVE